MLCVCVCVYRVSLSLALITMDVMPVLQRVIAAQQIPKGSNKLEPQGKELLIFVNDQKHTNR